MGSAVTQAILILTKRNSCNSGVPLCKALTIKSDTCKLKVLTNFIDTAIIGWAAVADLSIWRVLSGW